jgi:dephospho-CoA kinase
MPFCVGLTGGIGSGKSTVAELFRKRGAGVIDTDAISHELTQAGAPGHQAIVAAFGAAYLQADGALDRAKLRMRIFGDADAKAQLESILHPMIRSRVAQELAQASAPYVILVVPLLIETGGYKDLVQRTLVVDCAEKEQIERTMARSGLRVGEVRAIIANQATRAARLAAADDIVVNDSDLNELERQVGRLDMLYRELAAARERKP